ncbi:MAG: right-handed parallel beta-helix repeat-containing protein [Bacteroidales bacterium]|nr:right-handed parallel beta-helix repeat-containing protein [Bacteroidales bacterium]
MGKTLFISLLLLSVFCRANTFVVSTTADSGPGSLRSAIDSANANSGADTIAFNLNTGDPNFNVSQGTWVISLFSSLPYPNGELFINGSSQALYGGNTNPSGPEILITNANPGTVFWAFGLFSANNTIRGIGISGFLYGIIISEATGTGNRIEECYIGTDYKGDSPNPNAYAITISNTAANNIISGNLISGNTKTGIVITNSDHNYIYGNHIGCDKYGQTAVPNETGIVVDSSSFTQIGGPILTQRNIVSGNLNSGIMISSKTSQYNIIENNLIGTDSSGTQKLSNLYGITLSKASGNYIGIGNLISGNTDIGILLTGKYTRENTIAGNLIGTDISGTQLLDNHKGIIIKSLANSNTIGGTSVSERNIISGNIEIGIYIEAADSNRIIGNYIGTDISGTQKVAIGTIGMNDSLVQGNGVEFNILARYNVLGGPTNAERNIISGHKVYGVVYYGHCDHNTTINNFIGTDVTSQNPLPNATGICFDCASNHNDVIDCVLSGNIGYGLFYVTRGTEYNRLLGCMIGCDSSGTNAVPNDIGMVVSTGAANNTIGGLSVSDRNIFSGNLQSGLMITNQLTENNIIYNNYFGTDITGQNPLPNLYGIMVSTYASCNNIDSNLISGNTQAGIIITEKADSNTFVNNLIGCSSDTSIAIPNQSSAIYIDQGANNNTIGENGKANIIAYNKGGGIFINHEHCLGNKISANSFFENENLAIDIFPFSTMNPNDSGDTDTGPAMMLNHPVINQAVYSCGSAFINVSGEIDTQNPSLKTIEVYIAANDTSLQGQGKTYLGSCTPDASGSWNLGCTGLPSNENLCAICIDENGNTSEFSIKYLPISAVKENNAFIFSVYPNPATDQISVRSEDSGQKTIRIYSVSGTYIAGPFSTSDIEYSIPIEKLEPGTYFINIVQNNKTYSIQFVKQ